MQHCIASHFDDACEGNSYLFHVEHKGEMASVEVSVWGDIVQAYGPKNSYNGAVHHAVRILEPWCRKLRKTVERSGTNTSVRCGFSDEDIPF